MNNLSNTLKLLRSRKGICQKELAAHLKVSIGTVSNYELGIHEPDLDTLVKIAEYYDVSIDYLLGRTACPVFADMDKLMITNAYPVGRLLRLLPGLQHPQSDINNLIIHTVYGHKPKPIPRRHSIQRLLDILPSALSVILN